MIDSELLSKMKICSAEKRNLPIRIETIDALTFAISQIANRSDHTLKAFVRFDADGQSLLYKVLTSQEIEKNLIDFLNEDNAQISIITNGKEQFKSSSLYKNAPKDKFKLRSIPQAAIEELGTRQNKKINSFLIGDDESVLIGQFVFEDASGPTFVNFFDKKNNSIIQDYYIFLKDIALNGGRLDNDTNN